MSASHTKGQTWLIRFMQALGYQSNEAGVCHGLTFSARDAIFTKEISVFNTRYEKMRELYLDIIEPAWRETILEIAKTKDSKIDESKLTSFEEEMAISDKQNLVLKVKEKVSKKIDSLPPDKKALLIDIYAFFNRVELYYQGEKYPKLSDEKSKPKHQSELPRKMLPLTASQSLEKEGDIEESKPFIGAYSTLELHTAYIKTLRESLKSCDKVIVFPLNSGNHSIGFAYNPSTKSWTFMNPGYPLEDILDDKLLAEKIVSAFSSNEIGIMATHVEYLQKDSKQVLPAISKWQQDSAWKKAHEITKEKVTLSDSHKADLLYLATYANDINRIKEIIAKGGKVNRVDSHNLLHIAAQEGHIEAVKVLKAAGATLDFATTKEGSDPISMVIADNRVDILNELLRNDIATINIQDKNGNTHLYYAVIFNRSDMVKLLLEKGALPDIKNKYGKTAIDAARILGLHDIEKALKQALEEHRIALYKAIDAIIPEEKIDVDSPRQQAINKLVKAKSSDMSLYQLEKSFKEFDHLDKFVQHIKKIFAPYSATHPKVMKEIEDTMNKAFQDFANAGIYTYAESQAIMGLKIKLNKFVIICNLVYFKVVYWDYLGKKIKL